MTPEDRPAEFTRDDLDPLAVQVRALRQDLHAYRWAIEKILRRRLVSTIIAAFVGLALLAAFVVAARVLLDQEEDRATRTLEIARLESCASVRNLQAQVAAVLAGLPPAPDGPRPWLPEAMDRLAADPCVPAGSVALPDEDALSRP